MAIVVGPKSSAASPAVRRRDPAPAVAAQRPPIERREIQRADHRLMAGASVIELASRRVGSVLRVWVPNNTQVNTHLGAGTVISPVANGGAPVAGVVRRSGAGGNFTAAWTAMQPPAGRPLPHMALVRFTGDLVDQAVLVRDLGLLVQSNVQVLQPWEFWQPAAAEPDIVLLPQGADGRANYSAFADGQTIVNARPGAVDPTGLVNLARNRLGAPPLGAPPPKRRGGGGLILGGSLGAILIKLLKGKR